MRKEDWSHFLVILSKFFLFASILIIFIVRNPSQGRNEKLIFNNGPIACFDFSANAKNDYSAQNLIPENYSINLTWQDGCSNPHVVTNVGDCFSGTTILSFSSLIPIFQCSD